MSRTQPVQGSHLALQVLLLLLKVFHLVLGRLDLLQVSSAMLLLDAVRKKILACPSWLSGTLCLNCEVSFNKSEGRVREMERPLTSIQHVTLQRLLSDCR